MGSLDLSIALWMSLVPVVTPSPHPTWVVFPCRKLEDRGVTAALKAQEVRLLAGWLGPLQCSGGKAGQVGSAIALSQCDPSV